MLNEVRLDFMCDVRDNIFLYGPPSFLVKTCNEGTCVCMNSSFECFVFEQVQSHNLRGHKVLVFIIASIIV